MNTERLLKLASALEQVVKPEHFHLRTWASAGFDTLECGSVACAVGWYATLFPNEGLSVSVGTVNGGMYDTAWWHVESHFELCPDEAQWLFDPENYVNRSLPMDDPHVVASEIRRFITAGGIPED